MSGAGEGPKQGNQQGGVVESVKEAGANVVKTVQQKAGGSQVRSTRPSSHKPGCDPPGLGQSTQFYDA